MITNRPSAGVVVSRGEEIYNRSIRHEVEPDNIGKYVVIDIDTGAYRLGDDHRATVRAFLAERPSAVLYTKLIGYTAAVAIGGRLLREDEGANG